MKKLSSFLIALSAACALTVTAQAQDYPTNYGESDRSTHPGRYPRSISVTSDGETALSLDVASSSFHQLYFSKLDQVATVKAGSRLNVAVDFSGEWMNAYTYIDLGNDGQFSYDVDETAHTASATSDLRSFSFYSFSQSSDAAGYNSDGTPVSGDARSTVDMPEFDAPTEAGTYRMRVKVDWNNIDPAGATTSSSWGSLQQNGGVIVDFMLKVEADEPQPVGLEVPYEIDFGQSQEGWMAIDSSAVAGKTWAYNARGYYSDGQYYPCVTMTPDYSSVYNDWYVSPGFALKAGQTYDVSALAFATGSGPKVALYWGQSATDMSALAEVAQLNLPTNYDASAVQKHQVTVTEDGVYYFAFHGTTEREVPAWASLFSFAVKEQGTVTPEQPEAALPYTIDFKASAEGWQAVDNNGDGKSWAAYDGIGVAVDAETANDDFLSPVFTLEAGKRYVAHVTVAGAHINASTILSLLAGPAGSELSVVRDNLELPESGEKANDIEFVPTESGKFQFALRLDVSEADPAAILPLYLRAFGLEQKDAEVVIDEPVFSSDFTDEPAAGWSIEDQNGDEYSWEADGAQQAIVYDGEQTQGGADDWLVTPGMPLVEGQDYILDVTFKQRSAFDPDKVEFKYGFGDYSQNLSYSIAQTDIYAENGNGEVERSFRFTAEKTGQGYVGIHITTAEPNGQLALTKLVVTPVAKAVPMPVTDLQGEADANAGSVTLTWTNPSADTKGHAFASPLKANVYEGATLIGATDELEAGAKATYTFKPASMTGEATYVVRAIVGDQESAGASVTVNLSDIIGGEVPVKSFEDLDRTSAAEWKIEDLGGTSFWKYAYQNVFSFEYKNGQKNDDDWLISPAVELEAGKRYIAKYELATSDHFAANVDVAMGDAQTSSAMTKTLVTYPDLKNNGFIQMQTPQFSVPANGYYYFGFRAYRADYSVRMRNLVIYWIDKDTPTGIDNAGASAVLSYDRASSWLSVPVSGSRVAVYDLQGRQVAALSAQVPGVSLAGLPQGAYVVKVTAPNRAVQSLKILK